MPTLTDLEDRLRGSNEEAKEHLVILSAICHRLLIAMQAPMNPDEYQQFTLLLEAVIQAEDIINVIHFRYHNCRVPIDN